MQNQMDHLYAKQVGCGHPDSTRWEFMTHVHRDTIASNVGHHSRVAYMATAQNECTAKTRLMMLERMVQPCGPPPSTEE